MRTKLIIIPFVFLLLIFSASAIKIVEEETKCLDDGSIELVLKANSGKDAYTNDMTILAEGRNIKGKWEGEKISLSQLYKEATFKSRENRLVEPRTYSLQLLYKETTDGINKEDAELTFDLECPGLFFTCEQLSVKIEECVTSLTGKFKAYMSIYGMEQSVKGTMDPLEVIDYDLNAKILYKDINGYTSKRGSMPAGATVTKLGPGKYLIASEFDEYTTNHVTDMIVRFNDQLKRPCNPADYPEAIFSNKATCDYRETEDDIEADEDLLAKYREEEKEPEKIETVEELVEEFLEESEEGILEGTNEESMTTGNSVKEQITVQERKKNQLKVLITILFSVLIIGGVLLSYLYKQGYFY